MIRVFVIAPTPITQAGLHTILNSEQIQVVGTSAIPDAFVESIQDVDVIVVADEMLLEDVGRSLTNTHGLALIVLTNNPERLFSLARRLTLRGWGAVPLDAPVEQFQAAIIAAVQGMVTLPTSSVAKLYERQMIASDATDLEGPEEPLTQREQEVLELVSQGLSNKLIARRLMISEHTVKFHLSSLSAKLGASSRTEAVRKGLRRGWITV
jgi:DNA-binding NarL/FixJ family response regulator